eukprot:7276694-Prymnesium_polylepis.1
MARVCVLRVYGDGGVCYGPRVCPRTVRMLGNHVSLRHAAAPHHRHRGFSGGGSAAHPPREGASQPG